MNWIITGATGLIGRNLIDHLISKGEKVIALSRSAEKYYEAYDPNNILAINCDICNDEFLSLANIKGDIGLIMLASKISVSKNMKDLPEILNIDCYGHLRLIDKIKPNLRYCLYASSCTVYGYPELLSSEESAVLNPLNVYALTKTTSEKVFRTVCESNQIPLSILRIAQVYGPGAIEGGAIYNFLRLAHGGQPARIGVDPETFRDYVHVDDVITAIESCADEKIAGTYNIGGGKKTTLHELADLANEIVGSDMVPQIDFNKSRRENVWLDITKARKKIGYNPKIDIKNGLIREYNRIYRTNMVTTESD